MTGPLRLLVLTDSHYARELPPDFPPYRQCKLGCEFIRRTILDAKDRGEFDLIVLLGDLVNDGTLSDFPELLAEIRDTIQASAPDTPVLVVPGNHDEHSQEVLKAFDTHAGLHDIAGYRFIVFNDTYDGDYCTRSQADRKLLAKVAAQDGGPIIALQHNPLNPVIDNTGYPYMPTNRDAIVDDYTKAGVMLSLSGHYHTGQELNTLNGVKYFTAATVCQTPFLYYVLTLNATDVQVETRQLHLDAQGMPPIVDTHAHTEYAYCASGVTFELALQRARTFGLSGICFCEHAPQLYCCAEDFWKARHIHQPELWKSDRHSRMAEYRRNMVSQKSDFVRFGLEVEVDKDGQLILHEEDRTWADLLLGAIHWLMVDDTGMTMAEKTAAFLRTNESLLAGGVDVLAHPLRYFVRKKLPIPRDIYPTLAQMLADSNTAAEINFHTNRPDPAFFAECIQRGVKITLGSDAHSPWEPATFHPHVQVLREAAGREDITDLLMWTR